MRIYLVGFMAVGKTTIGRTLSERLGFAFVDLDLEVEREQGRSVKAIFEQDGEAFFRACERAALGVTRGMTNVVVATGGGTFTFPENRTLMAEGGLTVHLSAPFDLLASRIGVRNDDRPLFRNPEAAFDLFKARQSHYRLANLQISVNQGETPREIAERIILSLPRTDRST